MRSVDRTDPADGLVDVTPDDGSTKYEGIAITCRGTAGIVKVLTASGLTAFAYVAPGVVNPVRVREVLADGGNTATGVQVYL